MKWDVDVKSVFSSAVQRSVTHASAVLAADTHQWLVKLTPVDTGRARACWTASVSTSMQPPESSFISIEEFPRDSGVLPPPVVSADGLRASAGGIAYPKFHICNGQPYIVNLERGQSKKAPRGMVGVVMAATTLRSFGV